MSEERNFEQDVKTIEALYSAGHLSKDQKEFMGCMLVHPPRVTSRFEKIIPEDVLDYSRQVPYTVEPPNWAKFEYDTIKIRKDLIPNGAKLVEAYETDKEVIVCGDPEDEPDDFSSWNIEKQNEWYESAHNCDVMGCGSLSHVIYRFRKE